MRSVQVTTWLATIIIGSSTIGVAAQAKPNPIAFDSSPSGLLIRQTQNLYAYVDAGETLDVTVTKFRQTWAAPDAPTVTTIRGPGGVTAGPCKILGTAPDGESCAFANLSSATPGIWQIAFDAGAGRATTDWYTWDITPRRGAQSLQGQVWSEGYLAVQPSVGDAPHVDLSLWYQERFGFTYRGDFQNVQGIDSLFAADATGNHLTGTCLPTYRSADFPPPAGVSIGTRGCGAYKVFFTPPSAELPATATRWDGAEDWVKPPEAVPTVDALTFSYNNAARADGVIHFNVRNLIGPLAVEIDTNDDGVYTDPVDRTILQGVDREGAQSVPFDGNDGLGAPIARVRPIRIRVDIDRAGEIHLVNADIEGRGGVRLTRLTGTNSHTSRLYWNDTDLDPDRPLSNGCGTTPVLDGTAGVDSTPGVHGWATCSTGWGNERYIDDWTYEKLAQPIQTGIRLAAAPLVVTKRASAEVAAPGDTVEYVVNIRNISRWPVTATSPIVLTDDLTDALDDATYNDNAEATAGEVSYNAATLTWTGPVDAGGSVKLTYSLTIRQPDPGNNVVRDVVRAVGTGCDQGCTAVTVVQPPPELRHPGTP